MIYKEKLERDNYYKFKKFKFILVIICTFCLGYISYPLFNKTVKVKVCSHTEKICTKIKINN